MAVDRRSCRKSFWVGGLICAVSGCLPGLSIAQTAPVPPPPEQVSADCVTEVYATDGLVCESEDLRFLDSEMLSLWQAARDLPWSSGFWIEPQGDWFRRRSLCAFQADHVGCVRAAYSERITVLYLLQFPLQTPGPRVSCSGGGDFDHGSFARGPDLLLFMDLGLRTRIVAFRSIQDNWQPFVTVFQTEAVIRIERIDGATLVCPKNLDDGQ